MPERVFYEAQEQTLKRALGVLQEINETVGEGGIDAAVDRYLSEHGVAIALTVTDGDLDISLTAESEA